jgi:hypothetical protein
VNSNQTEYAAPLGLAFILDCGSTKMSRRWRCRSASCPNSQHIRQIQALRIEDNPRSVPKRKHYKNSVKNRLALAMPVIQLAS